MCTASTALLALIEVHGLLILTLQFLNIILPQGSAVDVTCSKIISESVFFF